MATRKRKTKAAASTAHKPYRSTGLRIIALLEAAKGILVLAAGWGLLAFVGKDIHGAGARLVAGLNLNPAGDYPRIFVDLLEDLDHPKLWALATAAMIYALVRLIEAYGLWRARRWAEWFGALSGSLYIPLELNSLAEGVTWPKLTLLLLNVTVVAYLTWRLWRSALRSA